MVFEPRFHSDDEALPLSNEENMPALSFISSSLNPSDTNIDSNIIDGGASTPIDRLSRDKTRDYCGNYIYMNDKIERIITDNGYIDADGKFHFYVKDYQGNNRMTVDEHGYTEGLTSYYPYGMPFADQNGDDRYKYSGKELDTTNGLNQYDFEARQQDFALGQFTSIDLMADKYYATSPYAYCAGNPILYVDPNGMNVYGVDANGNIVLLLLNNDRTDKIYKVNNTKEGGEIHLSIDTDNYVDNVSKDFMNNDYSINYNNSRIDINHSKSDLREVFNFFMNNTNVEWSHIITKNNNDRVDYLGTTHNPYGDYSGSVILQNLMFDGYHIIEANHNHTGLSFIPSLSDNDFATDVHKIYPAALLHIFIPNSKNKKAFDEYSKQEYDEVIITPKRK